MPNRCLKVSLLSILSASVVGPGEVTLLAAIGLRAIATMDGSFVQDMYGNQISNGTYVTTQGVTRLARSVHLATIK